MQMMPATFSAYHHRSTLFHPTREEGKEHKRHEIHDPEQNIDAGVCFLSELFKRYDMNKDEESLIKVLRSYNGGETKVREGTLEQNRENKAYPGKVMAAQKDRLGR